MVTKVAICYCLKTSLHLFIFCICTRVGPQMPQSSCGSQRTLCKHQFSLSITWAPRIEFRWLDWLASMLPLEPRVVFGIHSLTRLFFHVWVWFFTALFRKPNSTSRLWHYTWAPLSLPTSGFLSWGHLLLTLQLLLVFFFFFHIAFSNNITIYCFIVCPSWTP